MVASWQLAATLLALLGGGARAEAPRARGSSTGAAPHGHDASLRGGAWTRHPPHDAPPCGFSTARSPCRFVALASDEKLVTRWGRRHIVRHIGSPRVFTPFDDDIVGAENASVAVALSKDELYQLNTVDVDLTPRGVDIHGDEDWIGVYCATADAPSHDDDYIDWQWANASTPVHGQPHTRRVTFGPMVNMRCAWQFRYFARLAAPMTYVKLGESHWLRFALGDGEPLHVRLSTTTSPREMAVTWVSGAVTDPHVVFGDDPETLSHRVDATGDTYAAKDMCQAPATTVGAQHFRDPGVIYSAVLTSLEPGRDYYYRVGDSNRAMSRVFHFRLPPPPGHHPDGAVMSFFMYADLGEWTSAATGLSPPIRSGTTMHLVSEELETSGRDYVAVFHDGDLSYARAMAFQWDQFGALIEPVAARIPYMVSVGNHEYDYTDGGQNDPSGAGAHNGFHPPEGNYGFDSAGECGVPTNKRFRMPANGNQVFWYSTEMGLTHHTVISSEHDYTPGAPMHEWLVRDLASVDRARTPWLFVHLHRPLYCSEQYAADNRVADFLRHHLEPLLAKYRVDAVFSGHFHAFERTCPVLAQQCRTRVNNDGHEEARAPVHIMVGSAGASLDQTGYANVSWSAARQQEYGYGRVHVHNKSHAQFEFQRNRDGAIADRAWIISSHDW